MPKKSKCSLTLSSRWRSTYYIANKIRTQTRPYDPKCTNHWQLSPVHNNKEGSPKKCPPSALEKNNIYTSKWRRLLDERQLTPIPTPFLTVLCRSPNFLHLLRCIVFHPTSSPSLLHLYNSFPCFHCIVFHSVLSFHVLDFFTCIIVSPSFIV